MSHGVPLAARSFARSIAANKILSGRRVIQTGNLLAGGGAFSCLSVRYAPFRVVFVFHRLFVTFSFYSPILSVFLIFPPVSPFVCFSFFLFSFFFRLSPSFRIRRRESRWRHFGPGRTGSHLHQVALRRVIQVCAVPVDHFTCYCLSLFCFFVVADTTNKDKKKELSCYYRFISWPVPLSVLPVINVAAELRNTIRSRRHFCPVRATVEV